MLEPPFEIVRCSWPRAVAQAEGRWTSEPDWDAPLFPYRPQPAWQMVSDQPCFLIDWRDTFRRGVKSQPHAVCGDMCGFHVVFQVRTAGGGVLSFWDDDGSIIRRNGAVVHCDRTAHPLSRSELLVKAGDSLAIAQWQMDNDWLWGASFGGAMDEAACGRSVLEYKGAVDAALARPNGPVLKMLVQGDAPVRTILAVYSMILNGYRPAGIVLFGEHQWTDRARALFHQALPSAEIRPSAEILHSWSHLFGDEFADFAQSYWFAMKAGIALVCPPDDFCLMDDDVFVLDPVDDALESFVDCDAVFAPDTNHGDAYRSVWSGIIGSLDAPLPTARMNTGLLWVRRAHDAAAIARWMLQNRSRVGIGAWAWEQGLFANLYARCKVRQLPPQRYLSPLWEGLPGGVLGYDYRNNPCGFAAIHFAGLGNKPSSAAAAFLAHQILGRHS